MCPFTLMSLFGIGIGGKVMSREGDNTLMACTRVPLAVTLRPIGAVGFTFWRALLATQNSLPSRFFRGAGRMIAEETSTGFNWSKKRYIKRTLVAANNTGLPQDVTDTKNALIQYFRVDQAYISRIADDIRKDVEDGRTILESAGGVAPPQTQ